MSPNVRRVLIVLEEVGAPYELVPVDLMSGAQRSPEYLALNPNGRVPTLEVDDDPSGQRLLLWESHAIVQYLAARYPAARLDGERPGEKGEIAKWLFLNAAHFGPALSHVFAHSIRLPEEQRIPKLVEAGRAEANKILGILEGALGGRETLVAERVTLADLAYAPSLLFAPMLGIELARFANVTAWLERLKQRPSIRKVSMG
jgi:glutathione S-transferase